MHRVKLSITGPTLQGNIILGYANDQLELIDATNAQASVSQINYVLKHVPRVLTENWKEQLQEFIGTTNMHLTQVREEVTFEAFWSAYGKKVNRLRCEPLFAKLKPEDTYHLLDNVAAYHHYLKRTGYRNQADPENYLRKRMFENDWKILV
jgi:hypothetical protein